MPATRDAYSTTLADMRSILFNQTGLIGEWLDMFRRHQAGADVFETGNIDVLRVVYTMIHMTAISAHSVLRLTEGIELQTRDAFPIVRSVVESVVNILFILAKGAEAAQRAERHAQQKAYRDLKRESEAGGQKFTLVSRANLSPSDEEYLSSLAAEFTTRGGREKRDWTDESLTQRIDIATEKFARSSVTLLHAAVFNIYRPSSEILHGTYYSAMHFWGLTTPGRSRPTTKDELELVLCEHQFAVLMSTIFSLEALLECAADYVGASDLMERAKAQFDRLYQSPMIHEAMFSAPNGNHS